MAVTTRIYTAVSPAFTPTVSASWDSTTSALVRAGDTARTALTLATQSYSLPSSGTNTDALMMTVVYPLPVGTLFVAGVDTIRAYFEVSESGVGLDASPILGARVMTSGNVVQATLITPESPTGASPANEFSTTLTSRRFPRASAANTVETTYQSVAGDYLVVEIGGRRQGTAGISQTFSLRHGVGSAGTDLAGNESETTTTLTPWIEYTEQDPVAPSLSGWQPAINENSVYRR